MRTYKTLSVSGLNIAYREIGDPANPKLVLLHGFPSSSHQYRSLIPSLADRFHVISPDYPGFGNSDLPDPEKFTYTFDNLAELTGRFLEQKRFDHFGMYVQDYGGPVGFWIVAQKPKALEWLIIQNTNAYEVGLPMLGEDCAGLYGKTAHLRMKRELRVCLNSKPSRRSTFTVRSYPS